MRYRSLLNRTKFQVLVILVLCIQMVGPQQWLPISNVNSEGLTTTEPNADSSTEPVPKITITSPTTGELSKDANIAFSGTVENFTVGMTISILKILNGEEQLGSPYEVNSNSWRITDVFLPEGTHEIEARLVDADGKTVASTNITNLTVDTLRPTILLDSIVPNYTEDMTQVSINTELKFRVSEANALNEVELENIISVTSNGQPVPGDVLYNMSTKEISFIPLVRPLSRSTKYNVFISPFGDTAGNYAFPRFWSFTTESAPPITDEESGQKLFEIDYNGKNGEKVHRESPHAAYANNVNVCVNCHNTHEAGDPNLLEQKQNSENGNTDTFVDDYCMACHDGTVAPMPENRQATHNHSAAIDFGGKPSGSSCASCHSPHNESLEGNPNLAHDQIIYTHDSGILMDDKPVGKISSKEQLCESCHESGLGELLAQSEESLEYRVFQYKKNISAIGIYEDYDLCLRCHNPNFKEKYEATPDIAGYYNYWTEESKKQYEEEQIRLENPNYLFSQREISEQEMKFSGHIIKAQDGSPLVGQLPCAECHDTHGSNNIKQLKTRIGHENPQIFDAKIGDWDAAKERDFCVKCHNGETAIYGVIGSAIYDKTSGIAIDPTKTAHNKENTQACSECHSNNNSFSEAVHAPKRVKENPQ